MSIQGTLNGLLALSLLVASTLAIVPLNKAMAASLTDSKPVLIAQSEEKPKPKPEGGEGELGEDDC